MRLIYYAASVVSSTIFHHFTYVLAAFCFAGRFWAKPVVFLPRYLRGDTRTGRPGGNPLCAGMVWLCRLDRRPELVE